MKANTQISCSICHAPFPSHYPDCKIKNPLMVATLRDQFAMAAMPAILAKLEYWGEEVEGIAVLAYRQADAMLKQREENGDNELSR